VTRNFWMGREPVKRVGPFNFIDFKMANDTTMAEMRKMGINLRSPDQAVGTLSGGERQTVAIARAVHFGAKVLILDEPTSALGVKESALVLKMMKQAVGDGLAVVFITHNARHAIAVGDDFSVLIHGRVAANFRRGDMSRDHVLNLMAGGEDMAALEIDLEAVE
jgi:simple sugar transport system ATP-binding protein